MDLEHIPLDKITVGIQRIRTVVEDDTFGELCLDIAARGLLQPIGVTPQADGTYQLLWGLRRLTAARRLNWTTIPARVVTGTPESIRAIALRENIHRAQMSLEDECQAVMQLRDEEHRTIPEIATLLNRSTDWVRRRLTIANLPLDLRLATYNGELATAAAEAIALLDDPEARDWVFRTAKEYHWTVDDVRQAVKLILSGTTITDAVNAAVEAARTPQPHHHPRPTLIECATCNTPTPLERIHLTHLCFDCHRILTHPHNSPIKDEPDPTTTPPLTKN